MSTLTFRPMFSRALWLVLAALALAVILVVAGPAQPAAASCGGTTFVGTEAQLSSAIGNYNAVTTGPCLFTIQLTADIPLTASTTGIINATAGVSLVIEGAGFTVDGGGASGVRPFILRASNTRPVTFNQITITGGDVSASFGAGGGIEVQGGDLTVTNSTITGNTADTGGAMQICSGACSLTLRNSTISGNTATGGIGGGLRLNGNTTIDSSTIVNNQGDAIGVANSTTTVTNSILANSAGGAPDCRIFAGTVTDGGYNLVEDPGTGIFSCSFTATGSITGSDPVLGVLANNGGPTFTHALLDSSPAINAGNTSLTTDQRGYGRPAGGSDDIGAYEKDATPLAVTLASFDAQAQAGHVLVAWETVSELGNAGFNLYRTPSAQAPTAANLLAYVPSQAPGSTQGFAYAYQDQAVTAGETTWYWLADVDLNGVATLHGPVSVTYVGPTAVTLSGLAAAAGRPAAVWPWLLLAAALAGAALVWRRRSAAA